jgi:hypothetical protein
LVFSKKEPSSVQYRIVWKTIGQMGGGIWRRSSPDHQHWGNG